MDLPHYDQHGPGHNTRRRAPPAQNAPNAPTQNRPAHRVPTSQAHPPQSSSTSTRPEPRDDYATSRGWTVSESYAAARIRPPSPCPLQSADSMYVSRANTALTSRRAQSPSPRPTQSASQPNNASPSRRVQLKHTNGQVAAPARQPLPAGYTVAVKWTNRSALVAYGTDFLPADPRPHIKMPVYFCRDGRFGWHDVLRNPQLLDHTALYLGWLEVPSPQDAKTKIAYRPATIADVDQARPGEFRLIESLRERLGRRAKILYQNYEVATELFQVAFKNKTGDLKDTSIAYRVACDTKPPSRAAIDMLWTWGVLHSGDLHSFSDFAVCLSAHQRTSAEVRTYIDWLAAVLPANTSPEFDQRRHKRANVTRRGVILAGDDITTYHGYLVRLKVPTYIYVYLDHLDLADKYFRAPSAPRCSIEPDPKFDGLRQPQLLKRWYTPSGVQWQYLERTMRGYLPWPETEYELSDARSGLKRKAEQHEARHKDAIARKETAFAEKYAELGTSLSRFTKLTIVSPALRRYFESKIKSRPPWAPLLMDAYAAAEDHAGENLELLAPRLVPPEDLHDLDNTKVAGSAREKGKGKEQDTGRIWQEKGEKEKQEKKKKEETHAQKLALADDVARQLAQRSLSTFIPPLSTFTGVEKWTKTVEFVVAAVRLLPLEELEGDPGWRVLEECREVQTARYMELHGAEIEARRQTRRAQALAELEDGKEPPPLEEEKVLVDFEPFDEARFWKYGGECFFGKAESDRLKNDPNARPDLGLLPCGCEPVFEDLIDDVELVVTLLTSLSKLRLMHWLARLVPSALAAEGVPATEDKSGKHYTPDLLDEHELSMSTVGLIMDVALPKGMMTHEGWPEFGTPEEMGGDTLSEWMDHFAQLMTRADDAQSVDNARKFDKSWVPTDDLEKFDGDGVSAYNLKTSDKCALEDHLFLRYYLTSFKRGQWPVEVTIFPHSNSTTCSKCRQQPSSPTDPVTIAQPQQARWADEEVDEEDDEE